MSNYSSKDGILWKEEWEGWRLELRMCYLVPKAWKKNVLVKIDGQKRPEEFYYKVEHMITHSSAFLSYNLGRRWFIIE